MLDQATVMSPPDSVFKQVVNTPNIRGNNVSKGCYLDKTETCFVVILKLLLTVT